MKRAVLLNNRLYYSGKSRSLWRCSERVKHGCKSTCRVVGEKVSQDNDVGHNHPPLTQRQQDIIKASHEVKSNGYDCPREKPFHLITDSLGRLDKNDLRYADLINIRQKLYRRKRSRYSKPPASRSDCIEKLKQMCSESDNLIRKVQGNVVMIARAEDLQLLDVAMLELFADGTFDFSPRHFKQMYSFFVIKNGFYIPVAHFLLQNKREITYKKVVKMLLKECKQLGIDLKKRLKSGNMMVDFESGMIKVIKSLLKCKIKGCKFHLGQRWWQKIKDLGLAGAYQSPTTPEGSWLRGLFGLPFMPHTIVRRVFDEYCGTEVGKSIKLKQLQKYIKNTYTGPKAKKSKGPYFPRIMWAGLPGKKTNNGAEAWHRHYNAMFGYLSGNPDIWHFLRNLKKSNIIKDIKIRSVQRTKQEDDHVNALILNFLSGRLNVSHMLRELSFKNQPKCNLRRRSLL